MPRKGDPFSNWFGLGLDMWMLGAESSSVIALRTFKLAAGGKAASDEANLMVNEKFDAAMTLSQGMVLGKHGTTMPGIASSAVRDYRRKVRANQRRLTKG